MKNLLKYLLYFAFLLPLVFTSFTMYPWHFGKTIIFLILVEFLAVLALILKNKEHTKKLVLNKLDWLVIFFVLSAFISAIIGVNFTRSFWPAQIRAQGVFVLIHFTVFYFLLRYFFKIREDWYKLGCWVLIISLISDIFAWIGPHLECLSHIVEKNNRLSGIVGNPIFFSSYLIIPIFLGFAWFFIYNDKKLRWLWLGIGIINLITILFTRTRGAFIGLAAGIFIFWLAYLLCKKNSLNKRKKSFIFIGGAAVILCAVFLFILNKKTDYLKERVPNLSHLLNIDISESTASTRLMAWEIALKGTKDKPIFGWGSENYQDVFDKYYNPSFLKYSFAETVWDKPHNLFLEILSTQGIIGAFIYLAIIIFLIFSIFKIIKNEQTSIGWVILIGAVIAYFVQSLFAFETSHSTIIWMFLLAFISSSTAREKEYFKELSKFFANEKVKESLAIIIIILMTIFAFYNYKFLKASYYMAEARDSADIVSSYQWKKNALKTLDIKVPFLPEQTIFITKDLAIFDTNDKLNKEIFDELGMKLENVFTSAIKKYPHTHLYRFWLGQLYGYMGEYADASYYDKAEVVLEEAWAINKDRQQIPLLIAKNYLLQNKTEKAIELLENLAAKNKEMGEPHWFLGLAYMQNNKDVEKGMAELEKSVSMGYGLQSQNNVLYLIELYAEQEKYDKIIPLYKKLIEEDPNNAEFYANLAASYVKLGNIDEAVKNLGIAVGLNPALKEAAVQFLKENNINF